MTQSSRADIEVLEQVLLGQLPVDEMERLADQYSNDSRLAELAEEFANSSETLIESLRHHESPTAQDDDPLVTRLIQRLRDVDVSQMILEATDHVPSESSADPHPVPENFEYFRIQKVLGKGGMGKVYLAEDTRLGRLVALKTLQRELAEKPEARDRFLREARSVAQLDHDHIIPIYYVGESEGTPFLAMPVLQGETLEARLRRANVSGQMIPISESIRIVQQIAAGLAAAHAHGLIHRDVKPANIWLEAPAGRVKVLDFGLARSQDNNAGLTGVGAILGTPGYMAPEQAEGLTVDGRADLFSLGCVLYEMLTGNRSFVGPTALATLRNLANHDPLPPHEVNPRCPLPLSQLTMQLLAKQADERPASPEAVLDLLTKMHVPTTDSTEATNLVPGTAPDETVEITDRGFLRTGTPHPVRRRSLLLALVVLVGLIPLGWWLTNIVLRLETKDGTLVIEMDDKETEARIKDGELQLLDAEGKVKYRLKPSEKNHLAMAPGEYKITVVGVDGLSLDTTKFEMKNGERVTVRVACEPKGKTKVVEPMAPPDRKAAEYVLLIGGTVGVNGRGGNFTAVADLPNEPFQLTFVSLKGIAVDDAGLALLADCKNLEALYCTGTNVSDAGLAHFKGCTSLKTLNLAGTQISDAGLANFKDCNLFNLGLSHTKVTDAGLSHFKDCKLLTLLTLQGTAVTDQGLANFKGCKHLLHLHLSETRISDVGLAYFKNCTKLDALSLNDTRVTDAGLALLVNCKNLRAIYAKKTKITLAGATDLVNALPMCGIEWDGGLVRSKNDD